MLNHHLTHFLAEHTRSFTDVITTSEAMHMVLFDWWITLGTRAFFVSGELLGSQLMLIHELSLSPIGHRLSLAAWLTHCT